MPSVWRLRRREQGELTATIEFLGVNNCMSKQTWKLNREQKMEMVKNYQDNEKITCQDLATKFGISKVGAIGILRRNGIKIRNNQSDLQRRHSLDESFFEKIDTENKAYFLGWLYADGCNYTPSNKIIIGLQESDKDILINFKNSLNSSRPIFYVKTKIEKGWNRKNQWRFQINSKRMSQDLVQLGCVQKKSLILTFPSKEQVPDHLIRHFIRGFWEGDGSIFYSKIKRKNGKERFNYGIGFTSTKNFCISLQGRLLEEIGIFSKISKTSENYVEGGNQITTNLQYQRLESVLKFMDWIYKDACYKLERKWQKYQSFLEELRSTGRI